MSRDTWPGVASSPQTLNRYAYANNNPTTSTDPSGHFVDTLLDIGFIVFDIGSLVFGPPKDRGSNWLALAADVGSAFVPFVAGAGMVVRGARAAEGAARVVDANKLNHIFRPGKNLDELVRASGGSAESAYTAVQQAANQALKDGLLTPGANGVLPGAGAGVVLDVNGVSVQLIGGRVTDEVVHIGSFVGM